MRDCGIDVDSWETLAENRTAWKQSIKRGVSKFEANTRKEAEEKRRRRNEREAAPIKQVSPNDFVCDLCGRNCGALIGLHSHRAMCAKSH